MPAPSRATENWSDYQLTRGSSARRSFTVNDVVDGTAAAALVDTTFGVRVGAQHPEDGRLKVQDGGIDVEPLGGPNLYKVTASFGTNNPIGDGDPLDSTPIIFPQPQEQSEPFDRDWAGAAMTNSAYTPWASPSQKPFASLLITLIRYESTFNIGRQLAFTYRFCDGPVTLARVGTLQKYQLLCKHIQLVDGVPIDAPNVRVQYTLEARDYLRHADGSVIVDGNGEPMSGWAVRRLDQGRDGVAEITDAQGNPVQITGPIINIAGSPETNPRFGKEVDSDVLLDGFGYPKDPSKYAVVKKNSVPAPTSLPPSVARDNVPNNGNIIGGTFLLWDIYHSAPFQGLNLPNSPL